MKKELINATNIQGYVYEHKLVADVTTEKSKLGPGKKYIGGTLSVLTDEKSGNIVTVNYTFVTPTYSKSGRTNPNYNVLKNIIDGKIGNVMEDGKENAGKVSITSSLYLNDWYGRDDEFASRLQNSGGFISQISELKEYKTPAANATFETDMLITSTRRVDADEERSLPEKVIVKGYIFGYGPRIYPVEFVALRPKVMDFFENLDVSTKEPYFTKVKGYQISQTIVHTVVEEGMFDEDFVTTTRTSVRELEIIAPLKEPYEFDDESTLTKMEVKEMLADRELYLAELKEKAIERRNANKAKDLDLGDENDYPDF